MEDFFGENIANSRQVGGPIQGFTELFRQAYNEGAFDPEKEQFDKIKNQLLNKAFAKVKNLIYRPEEDNLGIETMPYDPENDDTYFQKMPYNPEKNNSFKEMLRKINSGVNPYLDFGGVGAKRTFGNPDKGLSGSINVDKRFEGPTTLDIMGEYKRGPFNFNVCGGSHGNYGANANVNLRF